MSLETKIIHEDDSELILECYSDKSTLVCPRCKKQVEFNPTTIKPGDRIYCNIHKKHWLEVKDSMSKE